VWERDVEARYQLPEWIESGELMLMEENAKKLPPPRDYRLLIVLAHRVALREQVDSSPEPSAPSVH